MTDHLEQAADRALELAEELCTPIPEDEPELFVIRRRIRIAAHLAYLSGLLRAGAVREPDTSTPWWAGERRGSPPDGRIRFYPSSGTGHYEKVQADGQMSTVAELAVLRAERGRAGEEILRLQRELNAANDQLDAADTETRRLLDQRNDLLDAARQVTAQVSHDHLVFLRQTVARVTGQIATPAEQAARLRVE